MVKFGYYVLCCLTSSLSNVVRLVDRQVGKQADENFNFSLNSVFGNW